MSIQTRKEISDLQSKLTQVIVENKKSFKESLESLFSTIGMLCISGILESDNPKKARKAFVDVVAMYCKKMRIAMLDDEVLKMVDEGATFTFQELTE